MTGRDEHASREGGVHLTRVIALATLPATRVGPGRTNPICRAPTTA